MWKEVRSEPILFNNVLWKRAEPVASIFRPPSCIYSRLYLAFKIRQALKHMISSFSFKHIATKVKKIGWYDFMFFDSQTKTPVSIILHACFYSNSMIFVDKPEESLKTQFICQFSQAFCGISHSCRLCCCVFKPFFVSWVTLRRKCKKTAWWSCCLMVMLWRKTMFL